MIRPTSDFAREAIFNILTHGKHGLPGHTFEDKSVLAVYCGTGALGLEALSRGTAQATFVDSAREAISIARHNAERMKEPAVDFILADATRLARAKRAYSLVFIDPPYFSALIAPTLKSLHDGGWIEPDGLIVAEHDAKETVDVPAPFTVIDERRYGRAMVKLLKAQ